MMMVVVAIPAIVVVVIAVRAVMMMVMMPSTVMVMHSGHLCQIASHVGNGSRLCENASEPRTPRIVFSIAHCQQHPPARLVSATTKSRWKFYAQVQRLSFHTAWVNRYSAFAARPVQKSAFSENRPDCSAWSGDRRDQWMSSKSV
jgi:hypothetical protein